MDNLNKTELKEFLDYTVEKYNRPAFIDLDPVSIPHKFSNKEDIEISSFLTATISWGNRKAILKAVAVTAKRPLVVSLICHLGNGLLWTAHGQAGNTRPFHSTLPYDPANCSGIIPKIPIASLELAY